MSDYLILILDLLTIFINLVTGFLVFKRNSKEKINVLFLLISIFFVCWTGSLVLYQFPVILTRLFWIKITYFFSACLVVILLSFSFIFPKPIMTAYQKIAALLSMIFLSYTFYLLYYTDTWIVSVVMKNNYPHTVLNNGYIYWGICQWLLLSWALFNFFRNSKKLEGLYKLQLKYLFIGLGIWGIAVAILDFYIPLLYNDTSFFAISASSSLFFNIAVAYSIIKHRLMDIRLVLARTLSYTILFLIIIFIYIDVLYVLGNRLFDQSINNNQLILSIVVSVLVVYTFQPLKRFLEKITDKIFFKENYKPGDLLSDISNILGSTIDLDNLSNMVLKKLEETMRLDFSILILLKNNKLEKIISSRLPENFKKFNLNNLSKIIEKKETLILYDELSDSGLKNCMRDHNISCYIKLMTKNGLVGLLCLGNKKSGDIFMQQDVDVLEILDSQMSVAIENARRYLEIQQFSETLKQKVKEATDDLKTANQRLKELDKTKDEFLNVAAHEMRAPLTAVKGYLSMIEEDYGQKLPKTVREFLQGAFEGAEREVRLVNNMLNVSRIEEKRLVFNMGRIKLSEIVKVVTDEFKFAVVDKKLKMTIEISSGVKDKVYVDQDRIHEVVANFISNAIKYTDKGQISIKLFNPDKNKIRFEVIDSGAGMTKEETSKLFNKFYRAQSSAGRIMGTGLGLYICKLLIKKFEGDLGVNSEQNKGSTFWFELPVI